MAFDINSLIISPQARAWSIFKVFVKDGHQANNTILVALVTEYCKFLQHEL
jgi:hypothetical protein